MKDKHKNVLPSATDEVFKNKKFSELSDKFLLVGLQEFGYRNLEGIWAHWLPKKTPKMIAHRYKNQTSVRMYDNCIKEWKRIQKEPFTQREFEVFSKALSWFGYIPQRWQLISKLFLPNRAPNFLRLEFERAISDPELAERMGRCVL